MDTELAVRNKSEFYADTQRLGELTSDFVTSFYPAYCMDNASVSAMQQEDSLELLNTFTFYKICECRVYNVEDRFAYFAQKMQQLFTTAYSIKQEVCYGIVSNNGSVSLLIGVAPKSDDSAVRIILEGLLPGVKLQKYTERFSNTKIGNSYDSGDKDRYVGCISGTPALKINGEYQRKDLSAMIRSLNGMNYTIMVMCKPVDEYRIQEKINEAIRIQDECFAISKRTLSYQTGTSDSNSHTNSFNESNGTSVTKQSGFNVNGTLPGAAAGAALGAAIGTPIPVVGNIVGGIVGGLAGLIIGKQVSFNKGKSKGTTHSISQGYSDTVTHTISSNESIAGDVQNGFAIDMMKMAESIIERLKIGRNIGMWESVISYSSDSELAGKIIKGSLYNNIASGIPEILPPVAFEYTDSLNYSNNPINKIHTQQLIIPEGFFDSDIDSPLLSMVTSEELCAVCNIPVENTFGFNIEEARGFALNYSMSLTDHHIGYVCEHDKVLDNIPFGLSNDDLNKHTFVCGITGSGKSNTVKRILEKADKPFMVIEPAKKEYRNICKENVRIYTFGRPEINCVRINPFYIMRGVSLQQHIDMLKDLFSASFAFYGPMPYIIEKCLYNVYQKKGWNMTLGFHPFLSDPKNIDEMFDNDKLSKKYSMKAHHYLFPTMQDLKDEIENYIQNDKEMTYEGEVKGNIQGALRARINSLCVGSKGYMFNTHHMTDFVDLMNNNTVIELEGLSDDADKAFSLGLLIIFINEYRQVEKEISDISGLQHLLVIEEAHRLLKNVSSEHTEELGNPKGKAVEHFTNMLAEMRSYGQGVIVAEQIPSKIAPDVIKNSSNKIIHRIVSKDDQDVIANTIGLSEKEAIYLGNSKTGYAVCHKEGMVQPIAVNVCKAGNNRVTDSELYNSGIREKMLDLNLSEINSLMSKEIDILAVKTLLSLMYDPDYNNIYNGLEAAYENLSRKSIQYSLTLVNGVNKKECFMFCIVEAVYSMLLSGVFAVDRLIDDELMYYLIQLICRQQNKTVQISELLEKYYSKKPKRKAVELVSGLFVSDIVKGLDVREAVEDHLLLENERFYHDVVEYIKGR